MIPRRIGSLFGQNSKNGGGIASWGEGGMVGESLQI